MDKKTILTTNRILLGLLMLIPGLLKLIVMGPSAIIDMLTGIGFPVPSFFAWLLIISEIVFGTAILAKYKLKLAIWPPIVILLIAAFTANWGNWPGVLTHLVIVTNYLILGLGCCKE
jgi:uncharacterized membrane protein YphA (DoxX/SURF4 family)